MATINIFNSMRNSINLQTYVPVTDLMDQDPNKIAQICTVLAEAGVPEEVIDTVRERLQGETESDGDLLLQHKGDRRLVTKKAYDATAAGNPSGQYDPSGRAARLSTGMDTPPPFSGRPTPGGQMVPITHTGSAAADRRLARDAARRTKVADAAGSIHFAKDAPRAGKARSMAFDANSLRNFHRRFPDAARIRVLG
jgi:hypothetical protein